MAELKMHDMADAMRRGVDYGLHSWLLKFELVEGVPDSEPWYGSTNLYANPFAIKYQMRNMGKAAVMTMADLAQGFAGVINSKEFGKSARAVVSGKYNDIDAAGLVRGILIYLQN